MEPDTMVLRATVIYGISIFVVGTMYIRDVIYKKKLNNEDQSFIYFFWLFFGVICIIFLSMGITNLLGIETINRMKGILAIMLLLDVSCPIVSYRNRETGFLLANTILLLMFMPLIIDWLAFPYIATDTFGHRLLLEFFEVLLAAIISVFLSKIFRGGCI